MTKTFLDKQKVFIHIPTLDSKVELGLMIACITWCRNVKISVNGSVHQIPLDHARNTAVDYFLEKKTDCTHFCGIDSDMLPTPGLLEALLLCNKDVIAPLIYTVKPDCDPTNPKNVPVPVPFPIVCERKNGKLKPKAPPQRPVIFESDLLPGGFYLVKRRVIEKLRKPAFRYKYDRKGYLAGGTDNYFSERIQEAGFKIHVHAGLHADQNVTIGAAMFNDTMARYCLSQRSEP